MDDYNKQAKSDINLKKGRTVDVIEKRECGKCKKISKRFQCCYAIPVIQRQTSRDEEDILFELKLLLEIDILTCVKRVKKFDCFCTINPSSAQGVCKTRPRNFQTEDGLHRIASGTGSSLLAHENKNPRGPIKNQLGTPPEHFMKCELTSLQVGGWLSLTVKWAGLQLCILSPLTRWQMLPMCRNFPLAEVLLQTFLCLSYVYTPALSYG